MEQSDGSPRSDDLTIRRCLAVAAPAAVPATTTAATRPTGLGEAVRAVDRLVTTRLERDQRVIAAGGAGHGEHLAVPAATTVATAAAAVPTATAAAIAAATSVAAATATTSATTRHAAVPASTWVVGEATAGEELLLAHREDERLTAIAAAQ